MYNLMTVQPFKVLLLTCVVKCTTPMPWLYPVVQWSVHWPGQGTVPLRHAGKKKMQALLLGLAKSTYYS